MNYYAVVFLLHPPDLLRCEPCFERRNVCNSQENGVCTRCATIVNHSVIPKLLRRVNLLRRSIFSTAGSLGLSRSCRRVVTELSQSFHRVCCKICRKVVAKCVATFTQVYVTLFPKPLGGKPLFRLADGRCIPILFKSIRGQGSILLS